MQVWGSPQVPHAMLYKDLTCVAIILAECAHLVYYTTSIIAWMSLATAIAYEKVMNPKIENCGSGR
jgi:hypothetical protein